MKFLLLYFLLEIFNKIVSSHVAINPGEVRSFLANDLFNKEKQLFTPAPEHTGPYAGSCKHGAVCVHFVSCPAHVRKQSKVFCKTIAGRKGICCTTGQNHTEPFTSKNRKHHLIKVDSATAGLLARKSKDEIAKMRLKEFKLLTDRSTVLLPGSASYSHFRNSRRFSHLDVQEVINVANRALEIAIATQALKDRYSLSNSQIELGMVQEDLRLTPLGENCMPKVSCHPLSQSYRTFDGTCNNERRSTWGAAFTPFARLLPASYEDGVWVPRRSVINGKVLPSPRMITTTVFNENSSPNKEYTLLLMQFGQFLSHDISHSLDTTFANGSAISCCSSDGREELSPEFRHYACMPVLLSERDNFYGTFQQGCMNFVRSVLAPRSDCTLGYAQQMNKVTHFIDGSTIYGSTPLQTDELRSFEGGRMKVFEDFGRELLPLSKDPDACLTMEQGSACFSTGDTRSNQMVTLVAVHTIFLREHNRIANVLAELNPHWEDEQIFLEARRIVVAELQVIVYKEFLPAVIGEAAMEEFDLQLKNGFEYNYGYDKNVEPSVTNEFSTAAFRFGHSMVDDILKIYGPKRMEEMIWIPEVMFYPSRMRRQQFLDEVLSSLTTEAAQEVDGSFAEALTKYLFRAGNPFGVDLPSINIQRGRDHGLRPYNDYRELVGLPRLTRFEDLGLENVETLKKVYASVDDIDLWVGGLLEQKAPGSIVGQTFRDIIADQFYRLKKGDLHFYDNDPSVNPGHFIPNQLLELRKSSMSRLICDNRDGILLARQAFNAFRKPGVPGNELIDCESPLIPKVNLMYWQE